MEEKMKLERTPTFAHEMTLTIREIFKESKTYELQKFVRDTKKYLNGTVHNLRGKKMKFFLIETAAFRADSQEETLHL